MSSNMLRIYLPAETTAGYWTIWWLDGVIQWFLNRKSLKRSILHFWWTRSRKKKEDKTAFIWPFHSFIQCPMICLCKCTGFSDWAISPLLAEKQLELSSVCLAVMQCVLVLSFNLTLAPPHPDPLILSCNETFSFVSFSTVCLWTSDTAFKALDLIGRDRMRLIYLSS